MVFSLLSVLFMGIVYASCESDLAVISNTSVYRTYVKQNLFAFLANPIQYRSQISFGELNASVKFFLVTGNNPINANVICAASTEGGIYNYGGVNLSSVARKFIRQEQKNIIPRCNDSTPYGECSATKPYFCYSGKLIPMCSGPDKSMSTLSDNCGCPSNAAGGSNATCASSGECQWGCMITDHPNCEYIESNYTECVGTIYRVVNTRFDCLSHVCVSKPPEYIVMADCSFYSLCCREGVGCTSC
jgi:hypothetical protein